MFGSEVGEPRRTRRDSSVYLFFSLKVSEFSHERLLGRESLRLQEVEQAEELLHSVLEGSSCQQDFVLLEKAGAGKTYLDFLKLKAGCRRLKEEDTGI